MNPTTNPFTTESLIKNAIKPRINFVMIVSIILNSRFPVQIISVCYHNLTG